MIYSINRAVKFNIVFSMILFVISGMLLDMGLMMHVVFAGGMMYWMSLFFLWLNRRRMAVKATKTELQIAFYRLVFCVLISAIANLVLTRFDAEPGLYLLLKYVRG